MLIIFGKKINDSQQVSYALTKIYGIGLTSATKICNFLNIPKTLKVQDLTEYQQTQISSYIKQHFVIETNLKRKVSKNIETLIAINSRKGFRHRSKLPVNGQRTHSNAKTCRRVFI